MRSGRKYRNFDSRYAPFKKKQHKKTACICSQDLVHTNFADGQKDGQTFFEKVLFFPPDQEYIYICIPISIISQISHPVTKVSIAFSILKICIKFTGKML